MLKTLFAPLQEFKRAAGLAALFAALEVVMEVLLPLVTARIIDRGISAGQMDQVGRYGVLMLVLAFLSLQPAGESLRQGPDLLLLQHRQVQHRRPGHPDDH